MRCTDCTLAKTMILADRVPIAAVPAALVGLIFAGLSALAVAAQSTPAQFTLPQEEPSSIALPLPEDRGVATLEQMLKRLRTTASVMVIVAHPDDEDGALLTYLSRGLGVRCTLLTLTRGEGGQNAMGDETNDALSLIRTNELLKADEYYGIKQLWGTEADFGFSKTREEAFARWGHERVLYDAVLAVRRERPQIILSTFVGGVTDGHGHHQLSGEITQEVFTAAADPKMFPEQLKDGLQPWQPLAVYSMVPFAPVTDKGMFDYATGKWAPAKFHNYITDTWTMGVLSTNVTLPVGTRDATLGRSYVQIAREGWGMQKSQYGGANPSLSGPETTSYHLWAVAPEAKGDAGKDDSLFHNSKVAIDTSLAGLAPHGAPAWLAQGLSAIDGELKQVDAMCPCTANIAIAHKVAAAYKQTLELRAKVAASDLDAQAKSDVLFELDLKSEQFEAALKELLGLDVAAFRTNEERAQLGGFRGASADETLRSVAPGEEFRVRVHTAHGADAKLSRIWLESSTGDAWKSAMTVGAIAPNAPTCDPIFTVRAAENAQPTAPYFTRPNIEQATYDVSNEAWRERSFAPWPLAAWAKFTFDGVPVRVGQVVQTLERLIGPGGVYEPLVLEPAIGVRVQPEAQILPLDGSALPVKVAVHTQSAAEGTVTLTLPEGWRADPQQATFKRAYSGDTEPIVFSVTPAAEQTGAYSIQAVVHTGGKSYTNGWVRVGYPGLRPYNEYKAAVLRTRKVDVKLAHGLRIGYVMGTGDPVPEAMEGMGAMPHLLSASEVASSDLSQWDVIVVGIRAYSVRPDLIANDARMEAFVRAGGTLVVQYQSGDFPAPLPMHMAGRPENVVDETAPVKLLDTSNRLLTWPNAITSADFDGWVEERGHSFLDSWDSGYTALTETADPGQSPQRGGLLVAHPGKGTYIYVAYALYRQLPELVPGSYRILANLLSAGKSE